MTEEKNTVASSDTATLAAEQATNPASYVPGFLPKDYLANGYHGTTDKGEKYLLPEFVGEYAETMAKLLADMKEADLNRLLRSLRRNKKSSFPYPARKSAALELIPMAMALVNRKKAPICLLSFIKDNVDHIHSDEDWHYFLRHFEAVSAFHAAQKGGDN